MKIINLLGREYQLHSFDPCGTHGVLRGRCGQPILFGFSVDERRGAHVLGFGGGEWRAETLEAALETALRETGGDK